MFYIVDFNSINNNNKTSSPFYRALIKLVRKNKKANNRFPSLSLSLIFKLSYFFRHSQSINLLKTLNKQHGIKLNKA
jgi:hypothetical protein